MVQLCGTNLAGREREKHLGKLAGPPSYVEASSSSRLDDSAAKCAAASCAFMRHSASESDKCKLHDKAKEWELREAGAVLELPW